MSEKKPEPQRISAIPPFGLRMLPALRKQIEEAADANKRSLNAEIVARLEESLTPPAQTADPSVAAIADKIVQNVLERVEKFTADTEARAKALEEENRALRSEIVARKR